MTHMIQGLAHIGVRTHNMEQSIHFYQNQLGLTLYYQKSLPSGTQLAFLRAGSLVIELIEKPDQPVDYAPNAVVAHIAIEVLGLDAMIEQLRQCGIDSFAQDEPITMSTLFPGGSRMIFLTGPMGEVIELYEYGCHTVSTPQG